MKPMLEINKIVAYITKMIMMLVSILNSMIRKKGNSNFHCANMVNPKFSVCRQKKRESRNAKWVKQFEVYNLIYQKAIFSVLTAAHVKSVDEKEYSRE